MPNARIDTEHRSIFCDIHEEQKGFRAMTIAPEDGWHTIGQHSLRFEAPDIVHMKVVGDLTLAEVERLLQIDDDFPVPAKGFFALIDIPAAGRPNLEILKSEAILQQLRQYRAFVYYRAQFQHRTVVEIVKKVAKTLKLSLANTPLVAFAKEEEAREWIDEHRQKNG